jgi:cyclophilin family peptidyl-prolyl cis-trans isomerase
VLLLGVGSVAAQPAKAPVVVVETAKGTFAFETFPNDAPATVAHIVALVRAGFYDGQRIHRAVPGFIVQFGDPQTRDPGKREWWGKGLEASSGHPVGVAEMSRRRTHKRGAVGIAHMGDPKLADSQIYVTLADRKDLDNQYTVFGQVIDGTDVLPLLQVGDEIRRAYLQEP